MLTALVEDRSTEIAVDINGTFLASAAAFNGGEAYDELQKVVGELADHSDAIDVVSDPMALEELAEMGLGAHETVMVGA